MAAEEHRGAVGDAPAVEPAAAGPSPRFGLFGLVALLLALALTTVAVIEARQSALLRQTLVHQDDYVVLSLYQVETEYLRLREQWARARAQGERFDADALQMRYDIFVSRVDLLSGSRAMQSILDQVEYQRANDQIQAFVQRADRSLGPGANAGRLDAQVLATLEPALYELADPIHAMSISAAHRVSEQIAQRNATVRRHNVIGLTLTLFLSALVVVFGVMAMRQMRLLSQRERALVESAGRLREAQRLAEQASQAKSVFLANMSHEIRTPFHGLLGMLSLLRESGLNARQVDYLRTATESADHLLTILNDVLDMSLLESGRLALADEPVVLRELLREVEALTRPQAQAKSLALHIDAAPDVPERARGDRTRIKQILFNLLGNAVKFSDQGAIVLELRRARGGDGAEQLEFAVTDTGIGMDQATLDRLFQRFSQGDESRSRRHGGTGLGLEISRSLARLMGGDIGVRSAPGEGSCFTLRMPLRAVEHAAARPAPPAAAEPGAATRALYVLVAEDHPVNRQYMAALLDGLGHQATFASNGVEAVQAVRDKRFDIVLMDLHMPLLDGVGATMSIRALPDSAAATVPIIALTADAFAQTRERCLMAGMNDFLAKPVSPEKLAATLRRLFGQPAAADAALAAAATASASAESGPPLIDRTALDSVLRVLPRDRVGALLQAFFDDAPGTLHQLRQALRDGQALELRVNAHSACGTALNLGLAAVAHTAKALHEGATHAPAHEIARLIERLQAQLEASREACVAEGLLRPQPVAS